MTACDKNNTSTNWKSNEIKDEEVQLPEKNLENGKRMNSLFLKEIDVSKKGVKMPFGQQLSAQITKGDDGKCYYFRKRNKKLIFYQNNGIKVCETACSDLIIEKGYTISCFVKCGDKFFLELLSYEKGDISVLAAIQIATGDWCAVIPYDFWENTIIYENRFYCFMYNELTIIDLQGKKIKVNIGDEDSDIVPQMILSDKILYTLFNRDGKRAEVICCDLDGKNRRKLFQYQTVNGYLGENDAPESLKVDEKYLYLLETNCEFVLTRIPLYGGIIEEITESEWFELSDTSIFYADKKNIYRIDKNLKGERKIVSKVYTPQYEIPFFYTNHHLMVCGYNETEHKMIDKIWDEEIMDSTSDDIQMTYSDEYYWITEEGKLEDTIEGSGFKNNWKKLYEKVK